MPAEIGRTFTGTTKSDKFQAANESESPDKTIYKRFITKSSDDKSG